MDTVTDWAEVRDAVRAAAAPGVELDESPWEDGTPSAVLYAGIAGRFFAFPCEGQSHWGYGFQAPRTIVAGTGTEGLSEALQTFVARATL